MSNPVREPFHGSIDEHAILSSVDASGSPQNAAFQYVFENFFHPYVGALIQRVNTTPSLADVFDASFLQSLNDPSFFGRYYTSLTNQVDVTPPGPLDIDVDLMAGAYATYNWEIFFHFPLAVAVHLSKNQRFAEAQRWFHYVFDPTVPASASDSTAARFWKFVGFRRSPTDPQQLIAQSNVADLVVLLSTPDAQLSATQVSEKRALIAGYDVIMTDPFQPHAVARTRTVAYQYCVVMKYLDNLIAWGDWLFAQDTLETLNEATLIYVLAANLLGPRPEKLPPRGTTSPRSYFDLRQLWASAGAGSDAMSNALVDLEAQFPSDSPPRDTSDRTGPLSSLGQTLYFCVPPNETLLGYWDTVADRLFKLRHCMNLQGIVQQLPLFDPPIDPGMLVKAAAAGIDITTAVSGTNQPLGPLRALPWIQKALELASEVRALGSALLSALEKGDAEQLAQMRQGHEANIQQLTQDTRFLQWKQSQAATEALLRSRASALERYAYYQRLLGLQPDTSKAPATFSLDPRPALSEDNFDAAYQTLVEQYDLAIPVLSFPTLTLAGSSSPATQSGASGPGNLYLNSSEDAELNTHLTTARDTRLGASVAETIASVLTFIPEFNLNVAFWGVGATSKVFGGSKLADAIKIGAEIARTVSAYEQDQASIASRTASHQRRADEWLLQSNLAARELAQIGRQLITSLVAEQVAEHEYATVKQQVQNAQEINSFLQSKFTNADLYAWMQGELSSLYYQYYRFALDTARKAERTMKQELMRPEVDAVNYIQANYWDGGRRGLLSGEMLQLDVKRMEAAYLDNNAREIELTRHVSLRRLDPFALLTLKMAGKCDVTVPEWLFDLDCPGHYMRRLKTVAVSIPSVVGPFQGVHCTLTLLRSRVRTSPVAASDGSDYVYASGDSRFVDYPGTGQQVVTSSGNSDAGLFEANLRDERFLPFEGMGACSTWRLQLPDIPSFDYLTISDVVLHLRYTARQGGDGLRGAATAAARAVLQGPTPAAFLLLSLRHDFPNEWAAFIAGGGTAFRLELSKSLFPYLVQGMTITGQAPLLCAPGRRGMVQVTPSIATVAATPPLAPGTDWTAALNGSVVVSIPSDPAVLNANATDVFLLLPYTAA